MKTGSIESRKNSVPKTAINWRQAAWILMLLADVGLLAWGAMAAIAPEHLLGPNSTPILQAEYENFTGYSWSEFTTATPKAVDFLTLDFRMYGIYGVGFSLMAIAIAITAFRRGESWAWWALLVGNTLTYVSAMTYDQITRAVGPFELTEYLGLAAVYFELRADLQAERLDRLALGAGRRVLAGIFSNSARSTAFISPRA